MKVDCVARIDFMDDLPRVMFAASTTCGVFYL